MNKINFVYFGTSEFSTIILDELEKGGFLPLVVITTPDKPQGRNLVVTPPPVKVWAEKRGIPTLQPEDLKSDAFVMELKKYEPATGFDLFIVASYGKIIPSAFLNIPKHKVLNVHPSLLPKLRGSSPIQSAILLESETGVSIMRLDEEMDHGPIVAQKKIFPSEWPLPAHKLEKLLAYEGGVLLTESIVPWVDGKINEIPQDHAKATVCKKIRKEDGLINLSDNAVSNYRKIMAFAGWPGAYFFVNKNVSGQVDVKTRVIVKDAELKDGKLFITRIVPEGKTEMNYEDFMRNIN